MLLESEVRSILRESDIALPIVKKPIVEPLEMSLIEKQIKTIRERYAETRFSGPDIILPETARMVSLIERTRAEVRRTMRLRKAK